MVIADACCFLDERGKDPIAQKGLVLNFGVATATPPTLPLENGKGGRPLTMKETLGKVKEFKDVIESQSILRLAFNYPDLMGAITNKQVGIVLGLQNAPTDADPQALFDAGIRIMSLAYYGQNFYGSGFLNGGIGLTDLGRHLILKCSRVGMIIDLSHVGYQTALDAIAFIKEKHLDCEIMASHSGCVHEYHHMRNILDDVMRGIVDLGGVVGITTITFNLSESSKKVVGSFMRHVEHAVKICGDNSVVIGTDSVYVKRTPEEAKEGIKRLRPWLDPLDIQGIRYPENIYEGPDLMQNIYKDMTASIYPYSSFALHDLSPDVVEGLMGKNLLNFFERALPA